MNVELINREENLEIRSREARKLVSSSGFQNAPTAENQRSTRSKANLTKSLASFPPSVIALLPSRLARGVPFGSHCAQSPRRNSVLRCQISSHAP